MKSQEKRHVDGSSSSGVEFSSSDTKSGQSNQLSGLPWVVKKVKLPEFSGFDPQGWIQKANLYFNINQTSDELRLRLSQLSMTGVAQHWLTIISQARPHLTWIGFQSELLQRFNGLIQNPYEHLVTIQQSDSIFDYIDDFQYVLSLVPHLPEYFVAGLKEDVKQRVRLHCPTSCIDAMSLAKVVELMLRPLDSNSLLSRFRYSSPAELSLLDPGTGPCPLGTMVSKFIGTFDPTSGQAGSRDRGVRSLSRTEWEERRKKGLCYKCGWLYSHAHKCPEGKLRVLLLGDDESEGLEGLHFQLEHTDHLDQERFSLKP